MRMTALAPSHQNKPREEERKKKKHKKQQKKKKKKNINEAYAQIDVPNAWTDGKGILYF